MSAARPPEGGSHRSRQAEVRRSLERVWLFDLDNTLHDAGAWIFSEMNGTMRDYVVAELGVTPDEADVLRGRYWRRYGSTLLGLMRHHAVKPAHFLHETHRFPDLERRVTGHRHDLVAIARLRGRKVVLTNAPRAYALRVLGALGIASLFEQVIAIEDMRMFGHWRPKPDRRMLRQVARRLGVPASRCVLVEDSLENVLAARRVGITPVWMQRFARRGAHQGPRVPRWTMRPAGVRVVRQLRALVGWPPR